MSSDTPKPEAKPSGVYVGLDMAGRAAALVAVQAEPREVQFRTTALRRRAPRK